MRKLLRLQSCWWVYGETESKSHVNMDMRSKCHIKESMLNLNKQLSFETTENTVQNRLLFK